MIRSILAVAAGYFGVAFLVVGSTLLLARAFGLPMSATSQPAILGPIPVGYLYSNLAAGLVSAVVGGALAAFLAPHSPLRHAGFVAGILLLFGVMFALNPDRGPAPGWYFIVMPALGVSGALFGGWLVQRARGTPRSA